MSSFKCSNLSSLDEAACIRLDYWKAKAGLGGPMQTAPLLPSQSDAILDGTRIFLPPPPALSVAQTNAGDGRTSRAYFSHKWGPFPFDVFISAAAAAAAEEDVLRPRRKTLHDSASEAALLL